MDMDNNGNLFVADEYNHRIRMITPGLVVSTLAGSGAAAGTNGFGAAAAFNKPRYLTLSPDKSDLYVSDYEGHRLRKIKVCQPGTYYNSATSSCSACPANTFNSKTGSIGASACQSCATGYTANTGSSSCTICPTGRYVKNGVCTLCPSGTYNSLKGATTCTSCSANTYNPNTGSSSISDCEACPINAISPAGSSSCTSQAATCDSSSPECCWVKRIYQLMGQTTLVSATSATDCCSYLDGTHQSSGIPGVNCTSIGNVTGINWGSSSLIGSITEDFENLKNLKIL
jgi:hypothetical protein